jgi:tetratricopeptide (TPR) repeat protein
MFVSCKHKHTPPSTDVVLHHTPDIPDNEARVIFENGLHFIDQGNYGDARQCFFEANRKCPNVPVILNAIGATFSQTGNPQRGNTYFERALTIDSNFINSYPNLGASLNTMMRYEEAKHIFRLGLARTSMDSFNRSSLFLNLANSYFLEREYDSASVFLDSAKTNSRHGKVYNMAVRAQSEINGKTPLPVKK